MCRRELNNAYNRYVFSILEMFSVGVGPSSSHTVGPMRAACSFVSSLKKSGSLANVAHVSVTLYGSLSLTGLVMVLIVLALQVLKEIFQIM